MDPSPGGKLFPTPTLKENSFMQNSQNSTIGFILYLLAWLACSVIMFIDLMVVRQATLDVMTAVQQRRIENSVEGEGTSNRINAGFVTELVDRGFMIVGAIAVVSLSIVIEHYLRTGRDQGKLYARIGKLLAILATILVIGLIVQTLI